MVVLEHSMDADEKDGTCSDVGVGSVVRHCLSFSDALEMFFRGKTTYLHSCIADEVVGFFLLSWLQP